MPYRIAAIDVHKMVLKVVVATAAEEVKDPTSEALGFEFRRFGALDEGVHSTNQPGLSVSIVCRRGLTCRVAPNQSCRRSK